MTDAAAYPSCKHGRKIYERCTECEADMKAGIHGGFERTAPSSKQKSLALLRSMVAEIWSAHREKGHEAYNECDEVECAWCENTREALAVLETSMATSSAIDIAAATTSGASVDDKSVGTGREIRPDRSA